MSSLVDCLCDEPVAALMSSSVGEGLGSDLAAIGADGCEQIMMALVVVSPASPMASPY